MKTRKALIGDSIFLAEVVLHWKLSGSGPRKLAISFSKSPRIAGRDSVVASDATMRPRKPKTTVKGDLFRAALEQLINMKHELVQLAADIIVDQVFDRLLRKLGSFRNKQECTVGSGAAFGGYVGLQKTSLSCRRGEACQMPTQTRWLCWERILGNQPSPIPFD